MRGGIWREPRKLPPFLCALFQIGKDAENPCHSPHQQRKTSANFKAKPRTGGRFARGFRTGKRDPGKANMTTKKKKPAAPAKQQNATKSAAPSNEPLSLSEIAEAWKGMHAKNLMRQPAFEGWADFWDAYRKAETDNKRAELLGNRGMRIMETIWLLWAEWELETRNANLKPLREVATLRGVVDMFRIVALAFTSASIAIQPGPVAVFVPGGDIRKVPVALMESIRKAVIGKD